jgi:hypothetical protein
MVESALVTALAEGEFTQILRHSAGAVSVRQVRTFGADSVLTTNRGVTVALSDGTEFQLTIVKSRGVE